MNRSAVAAHTPARSRRRVTVLACEDRPVYRVAAEPHDADPGDPDLTGTDGAAGDATVGSLGRPAVTDERAPAEHVDAPRREDAVVSWAGPSIPTLSQLEGRHDRPPTGPVPRAARLRDLVGRDGLPELDEPDPFPDPPGDREQGATGRAADDRGPGVRDRVRAIQQDARGLLDEVSAAGATSGELGALVDLASVADTIHAVMVALTAQVEDGLIAERRAALPLVEVLAIATRLTKTERRQLLRAAATRGRLPALDAAVHAGLVGAAEARAVLASCRGLDADGQAEINELFIDQRQLATQTVDAVLDEVASQAVQIADRKADDERVKAFERRFLAVQRGLEGTISGYFEIDDQSGAILLRALQDAAPPITSDKSLTRDAQLPPGQTPTDRRTLGRRRADGLISLAEPWLASHPDQTAHPEQTDQPEHDQPGGDGPDGADATDGAVDRAVPATRRPKRARPLIYVWTDIETLVGTDTSGAAARLLWDTLGPNPVLTPTAVRRLADDARLQFILTSGDEILGVAAPVTTIPTKVRAALHARDQGCRFPGCAVPIHQTDLHHVIGRAQHGHTTVTNLVALCRRHHQAITDARWILTMTDTGQVRIRRGRHTASTDPPAIRRL